MAKKLFQRLSEINAVECLAEFNRLPHIRCHSLKGKRKGQFAVYIFKQYRLVFWPIFKDKDSLDNIDFKKITGIKIKEVVDYHD